MDIAHADKKLFFSLKNYFYAFSVSRRMFFFFFFFPAKKVLSLNFLGKLISNCSVNIFLNCGRRKKYADKKYFNEIIPFETALII